MLYAWEHRCSARHGDRWVTIEPECKWCGEKKPKYGQINEELFDLKVKESALKDPCPYCNSDVLSQVFYDQTCPNCVMRMSK